MTRFVRSFDRSFNRSFVRSLIGCWLVDWLSSRVCACCVAVCLLTGVTGFDVGTGTLNCGAGEAAEGGEGTGGSGLRMA